MDIDTNVVLCIYRIDSSRQMYYAKNSLNMTKKHLYTLTFLSTSIGSFHQKNVKIISSWFLAQ